MDDKEIKKTLDAINSPLRNAVKKIQDDLNPLKTILSQLDKVAMPKMAEIVQPELPRIELPVDHNLASEFHKRLIEWIQEFDKHLDQEHEVGVRLVSFGQTVTFHLKNIGYWNPSLISFSGFTESGEPVELIQHVSQISILLLEMKREDPSKPKRPIGLTSWEDEEQDET